MKKLLNSSELATISGGTGAPESMFPRNDVMCMAPSPSIPFEVGTVDGQGSGKNAFSQPNAFQPKGKNASPSWLENWLYFS